MRIKTLLERYWKVVCVIVSCWTFLALLFTPETANLRSPSPLTWAQALFASLTLFYVWAALTPLVLWLGSRLPFERHALRNVEIHLLLCGPVALLNNWLLQKTNGDQDLVLQNGRRIMLSRNYRDKFFALLGEL